MQACSGTEFGLKTGRINLLTATLLFGVILVSACSRSDVVQRESGGAYMNAADLRRMEHFATLPNQWNIGTGQIVAALNDPELGVEQKLIVFDKNMIPLSRIAIDMENTVNEFENAEARRLFLPIKVNYRAKWDALLALNKGYEARDAALIEAAEGDLRVALDSSSEVVCALYRGLEQYASGGDLADLRDLKAQIC